MIDKYIRGAIAIFLSLSVRPALTQPTLANGYAVQHFTDENGLPQNSVNDLLFDGDGYLWLASQVGLIRFDGNSFRLFYPDDKPVLESYVQNLGRNEKGELYFQTLDHNLYCYPAGNGQFVSPINTPVLQRPYLLNTRKQLFDFSPFLKSAADSTETRRRKAIFGYLFGDNDRFFAVDTHRIYFADKDSLYYFDGHDLRGLFALAGKPAQFLLAGEDLYIIDRDSVIAVYRQGKQIAGPSAMAGDLAARGLSVHPRREGEYRLFASEGGGHLLVGTRLYRLLPQPGGILKAEFLVDLGFIPNISAVEYHAGLDLLLVATTTEGVYFLRRDGFQRKEWPEQLRNKLAGYPFGPLALYKGTEILTDKFSFDSTGAITLQKDTLPGWQRCLFVDHRSQVWDAFSHQPRIITPDGRVVRVFQPLDATVIDYAEDSAGRLYCLTESSLWRLETNGFRRLYTIDRDTVQANESVAFIAPHRCWIANTNGLIEYDPDRDFARNVPELAGMHVRTLHRCRDGNILAGTYGQGYLYYDKSHWHRMPLDKNSFLITANCFLEDNHGLIWIACNKGLFCVPLQDIEAWARDETSQLYYYYYGQQDGLQTNEFNGGFNSSGVITDQGLAALLSMKGMVCFKTGTVRTDFPSGTIVMTGVEVDGHTRQPADTISVSAGYNNLRLQISCPYFGNRNNLYLQYHLAGLKTDWEEVPGDGMLNFSRLQPGSYTLQVRKVNGFGKSNYQYREWSILVPPAFYRTTWFMALVILLVLTFLAILIQSRLKLRDRKRKLNATVHRLQETVEKLQSSEKALLRNSKQREKLISLVIHDLRSPLRFLNILAADLHDNQDKMSPAEIRDRTYWIKKGAQDVYNFSEDFLLWVTSLKENFRITKQLFFVRPLLQEIADFYREQAQQKGNTITYEAAGDLQLFSDPHLLLTIIRNLTDNANKYTSKGSISLGAKRDGDDLLLSVADTGKGMNPRQVEAFLGRETIDDVKSGSQLGHKFVSDLTHRLNGMLSVESMEGNGTRVYIRIPVGPHLPSGPVPPAGPAAL
jgi:signal transduction histidine kinase